MPVSSHIVLSSLCDDYRMRFSVSNFLDQHPSFKNDSCSASRPPLSLEEQFASTATATIPKVCFVCGAVQGAGEVGPGQVWRPGSVPCSHAYLELKGL